MSATLPVTLITATPGGGKTALAVQMMSEAVKIGRPLFVSGIPELKLSFISVPPINEWTEMRQDKENSDVRMPYFTFPENSLIVIDEAQRFFRVRYAGSKVPDHVAAFETVRHTGVTFLLITQNPSFIDSHIRKLVGQHIHLRDVGVLGRWYYEWPECANPESFSTAPIKKKWRLPKSSFGLYKSSSLHIKRKYSMPPVMLLLLVMFLIFVVGGWRFYTSMLAKMSLAKQEEFHVESSIVHSEVKNIPSVKSHDGAEYLAAFVPMVSGYPESASAYEHLRQVVSMPRVAGAICMKEKCVCYTQQGTNAGLDNMQCRSWLRSPYFDPYSNVSIEAGISGVTRHDE